MLMLYNVPTINLTLIGKKKEMYGKKIIALRNSK